MKEWCELEQSDGRHYKSKTNRWRQRHGCIQATAFVHTVMPVILNFQAFETYVCQLKYK